MSNDALAPLLPPLRPPGAAQEEAFRRLCVRCGQCVTVCPHKCVELAGGLFAQAKRLPRIQPRRAPCYLCMQCPPVCPTGALDAKLTDMARTRMGRAYILKSHCHNYTDGIMCMTCYDRCPLRGSAVVLADGLTPAVTTACVGCGVCEYVCPVEAIALVPASSGWVPLNAAPVLEAPKAPADKEDGA